MLREGTNKKPQSYRVILA